MNAMPAKLSDLPVEVSCTSNVSILHILVSLTLHELIRTIAHNIASDADLVHFRSSCSWTRAVIDGEDGAFWRERFQTYYDGPRHEQHSPYHTGRDLYHEYARRAYCLRLIEPRLGRKADWLNERCRSLLGSVLRNLINGMRSKLQRPSL